MTIVGVDSTLAFLLTKTERVYFSFLREFKNRVESRNNGVVVPADGPSIDLALHHYPFLFNKVIPGQGNPAYVERSKDSEEYFNSDFINTRFLRDEELSRPVRETFETAFAEMEEEGVFI